MTLDGCGRDHAAVGHHADPSHPEAITQPIDNGQQHGDVGGVAGDHLGADRTALAVDHHRQHHLLQIGAIILGMAMLAQALAAFAVERQGGRVHEHQRQIREQITPSIEQPLFDLILHTPWR